jgi:hypothetical protein
VPQAHFGSFQPAESTLRLFFGIGAHRHDSACSTFARILQAGYQWLAIGSGSGRILESFVTNAGGGARGST